MYFLFSSAIDTIQRSVNKLTNENTCLGIAPEGTRSKDGNVAPFKAALPTIVHYCESDVVLVCIHNSQKPLNFRMFTYPKEIVNIKFFEPLSYDFYLQNRKEYGLVTHDMIQSQLDEFKK